MYSQDERPVLFIVTAGDCRACIKFKADGMAELIEKIKATGRVQVRKVELNKMGTELPYTETEKWPKDLGRFIGFYPCIGLINGRLWSEAEKNRNVPINAIVYNGKLNRFGVIEPESNQPNLSHDAILKWINLNTNAPINAPMGVTSTINTTDVNNVNICAPGTKFKTRPVYT